LFAAWWFEQNGEEPDASTSKFRAMLAKAKMLKAEGFDLELVKRAILTMRRHGETVRSPYAVKLWSPDRTKTWYEYSLPLQVPVWDSFMANIKDNMPLRVS